MLGSIIGDIVGSRFEFHNHRSKEFDFFAKDCFVTDDSIMMLAVAKAILACEGDWKQLGENTIKYMQTIGRKYPDCGYGGMFRKWMFSDNPKPYNSYGNGAAMRVSPCGFIAQTEDEAKQLSKKVTEVTHNHAEGIKGAEATTIAIFMARNGATKDEIKERIENNYYKLDFTIDEIREYYQFNETCQGTVPQAIMAFLESVSFEDAIRNAISVGGDSDTLAAIAGGIAEAYYSIPSDLKRKAQMFLNNELRGIYKEWNKFIKKTFPVQKFISLTKYIDKLNRRENIDNFNNDFYHFLYTHPEHDVSKFNEILEKNNLRWETESMQNAQTDILDDYCVIALLIGVFHANHYAEGVNEEFIRSGAVCKWLNRLKILDDERKIEEEKPALKQVKIFLQLFGLEGKNELFITENQISIKYDSPDGGTISHQYEFGEEIEFGRYILIKMTECLEAEGWIDQKDIKDTGFLRHLYKLEAEYDDGKIINHHGAFDRAHIPDKEFTAFIDAIRHILNICGYGDIINLSGFMSVLKPGEVKYCGVEFSDSGRIYHYRTTDVRIKVGDTVIVPVGSNNYEKEATIKAIEFCRWDNTPYPLEKTKEIIKLADEDNSRIKFFSNSDKKAIQFLTDKDIAEIEDDDYE